MPYNISTNTKPIDSIPSGTEPCARPPAVALIMQSAEEWDHCVEFWGMASRWEQSDKASNHHRGGKKMQLSSPVKHGSFLVLSSHFFKSLPEGMKQLSPSAWVNYHSHHVKDELGEAHPSTNINTSVSGGNLANSYLRSVQESLYVCLKGQWSSARESSMAGFWLSKQRRSRNRSGIAKLCCDVLEDRSKASAMKGLKERSRKLPGPSSGKHGMEACWCQGEGERKGALVHGSWEAHTHWCYEVVKG